MVHENTRIQQEAGSVTSLSSCVDNTNRPLRVARPHSGAIRNSSLVPSPARFRCGMKAHTSPVSRSSGEKIHSVAGGPTNAWDAGRLRGRFTPLRGITGGEFTPVSSFVGSHLIQLAPIKGILYRISAHHLLASPTTMDRSVTFALGTLTVRRRGFERKCG